MTTETAAPALSIHALRYFLDRMLANLRVQLLQTRDGRAFLDTAPEDTRRMLKHATWTLTN